MAEEISEASDGISWQTPTGWVDIHGRWDLQDSANPIYLGDSLGVPFKFGLCLSNARLMRGDIQVDVTFPNDYAEARILFGYSTNNQKYYTAGLGGWDFGYSIQQYNPNVGIIGLKTAGLKQNIKPQRKYKLGVRLRGSRVVLSVDGVDVLDHILQDPLVGDQIGLLTIEDQEVRFSRFRYTAQTGEVFVVMQFTEPYFSLYKEVIKPVVCSFQLSAYHAGEVFGPGVILQDIVQGLIDAKVVIVEVSPENPNVYYELGYAHALGKPTILLAERGNSLPFDISGYRTIFYEDTIAGKRQVEESLRKHLTAILGR